MENTLAIGWEEDLSQRSVEQAYKVSAANLTIPTPPRSLKSGLSSSHPDHDTWHTAYHEEYRGLEEKNVFYQIDEDQYQELIFEYGEA